MKYRTLGKTGLKVSLASFGTGGPSQFGQRKGLEQRQQTALVRRCLELGVNLFDTHEGYGESEIILGEALQGVPRDSYHLVTKWSYHSGGGVGRDAAAFAESVERSLTRLNTDYVDVMMIHGILAAEYDSVMERFAPTLERLCEQGKVRFKGFSTRYIVDPAQEILPVAMRTDPDFWDVVMLKYGILNQIAAKEALPLAMEHDIGVLNMASVRIKLPVPALLEELIAEWKIVGYIAHDSVPASDPLGWLVRGDVDSVVSAAYKFAAEHPAIASVITGTSSMAHLDANIAALQEPRLPKEDSTRLKTLFGDIAEYA
ncbi:MAG: aldo/keto reductase [Chloroflexi bacterium]|nr:aldo/keto reductase [Chloroflexota bacterium]